MDVIPLQNDKEIPKGVVGKPARAGILSVRNHVKLNLDISIGGKSIGTVDAAIDDTTPTVKKINLDLTEMGDKVKVVAEVAPGQLFAGSKWTRDLSVDDLTLDAIPFQNDK